MKGLLCIFLGALVVFAYGQNNLDFLGQQFADRSLLTVDGSGSMLVASNRTTLTVTLYGFGTNATAAQTILKQQIDTIMNKLSGHTLLNVQMGGIMYYPYYSNVTRPNNAAMSSNTGSTLNGFIATTTFSFTLSADDAAMAIDALVVNNTAYISLSSRPDIVAVEDAERRVVMIAVDDALLKAQAALDRLQRCAINFTLVNIQTPMSELPVVNIITNNFGISTNNNVNLSLNQLNSDFQSLTSDNTGAGRNRVSAFVKLNLFYDSCDADGAIRDLTANGITLPGSSVNLPSAVSSSAAGSSGIVSSASASASGSSGSELGSSGIFSGSSGSELGSSGSELGSSGSELGSSGSGSALPSARRRFVW